MTNLLHRYQHNYHTADQNLSHKKKFLFYGHLCTLVKVDGLESMWTVPKYESGPKCLKWMVFRH